MKYAMDYHAVPVLGPTSVTAAATSSAFVNLKNYEWVDFHINIGVLTGDDITVTVEEATANSTSGITDVAIPFVYRGPQVVGTDSMGAVTTASSAGCTIADSDSGTHWVISVDPNTVDDGYNYVRVTLSEGSSSSAAVKQVLAVLKPRYAKASPPTSS